MSTLFPILASCTLFSSVIAHHNRLAHQPKETLTLSSSAFPALFSEAVNFCQQMFRYFRSRLAVPKRPPGLMDLARRLTILRFKGLAILCSSRATSPMYRYRTVGEALL